MKNTLLILIFGLFLIIGISCVAAVDLDSSHGAVCGSGLGGGEYTPFYSSQNTFTHDCPDGISLYGPTPENHNLF